MVAGQTGGLEVVKLALSNVRFGSQADIGLTPVDVRYSPKSGHWRTSVGCPLCANNGLMQCSKRCLFDHLVRN